MAKPSSLFPRDIRVFNCWILVPLAKLIPSAVTWIRAFFNDKTVRIPCGSCLHRSLQSTYRPKCWTQMSRIFWIPLLRSSVALYQHPIITRLSCWIHVKIAQSQCHYYYDQKTISPLICYFARCSCMPKSAPEIFRLSAEGVNLFVEIETSLLEDRALR